MFTPSVFSPDVSLSRALSTSSHCRSSSATPASSQVSRSYDGPLDIYLSKVKAGELNADPQQQKVVERLQKLHNDLKNFEPAKAATSSSWFAVSVLSFIWSSRLNDLNGD